MRTLLFLLLTLMSPLADAARADVAKPNPKLTHFFTNLKTNKKQTIVTYGTSLTKYGVWAKSLEDYFTTNYPNQVTVINSGGPGQCSKWGLEQLKPQVLDNHPDLVFIEFSTNDAHTRMNLPVVAARDNLDKIVASIRAQNPDVALILQTMNAPWDCPTGSKTGFADRPQLEAYNDNYRAYAREHGIPLIDNYPQWLALKQTDQPTYEKLVPDGTHPGKDGQLAVTWPNIKALLDAARLTP